MEKTDFTRNRKQPFSHVLLFMINFIRKSLTIEIDNFTNFISKKIACKKDVRFTSSAFVQNRKKINPLVFKHLYNIITDNFYLLNSSSKLFHGFRLLAVDGSLITLPNNPALKKEFGVSINASKIEVVQAKASVLYDVSNKLILDSILSHQHIGERELALKHQEKWKKNDLIIYDRGYSGFNFYKNHLDEGVDFVIRVTKTATNYIKEFVASGKTSSIIEVSSSDKKTDEKIKIRLVRVELSNGEVEILVSSLLDSQKYPSNIFKELYFKRWKVETFYDELKNKLKIEHFSGYSIQSIQQDFYCAIFVSNLQSVIINDIEEELIEQNKGRKYEYKINTNLSYGLMKNRILELLYSKTSTQDILNELEEILLKNIVPIRPNRSNPREMEKFKNRTKPKCLKNHKDAI